MFAETNKNFGKTNIFWPKGHLILPAYQRS